jgi:putative membrane protein
VAGFLLRCIFNSIVLVCVVGTMPGIFVDTLGVTLVGATMMGVANAFIRPVLTLLSVPLESLGLGLTTVVTNVTVPTVAFSVLPGIEIHGLQAILILMSGLSISSYFFTRCIQDR